jgi:CDP-diacylglycerol--glycerol-3-phosphate 3-phosphatidyltransferase
MDCESGSRAFAAADLAIAKIVYEPEGRVNELLDRKRQPNYAGWMPLAWPPWALVAFRLLLGPALLLAAARGVNGLLLAAALGAGILSDVADGVMARRLGSATQRLRRVDSLVDTVFVLCALAAAWIAHSAALAPHLPMLALMLAVNVVSYIPAFIKFGRAPAYHAYSAKASGLALFAAGVWLFARGEAGSWLDAAIVFTIPSHLDRIAITLLLPEWRTDVAGIWTLLPRKSG